MGDVAACGYCVVRFAVAIASCVLPLPAAALCFPPSCVLPMVLSEFHTAIVCNRITCFYRVINTSRSR